MLPTWRSAIRIQIWLDSAAYRSQRCLTALTTAASCQHCPAKASTKRSQVTTIWVRLRGTRSVKLQIRCLKLKEITETLQNQRMPTIRLTCSGRSQAWASETKKTKRRRKRRTRRRARRSEKSDIAVKRGRNFHCFRIISFTHLEHTATVILTRTAICRMATTQLKEMEPSTCSICSSRRVAGRDCILLLCSQVMVGILEISHSEKERTAALAVFHLCLDHKVAIRDTCTWLLKTRVKATWAAPRQPRTIPSNTCTACHQSTTLITTRISSARATRITKWLPAFSLQACIHQWFRTSTWAATCTKWPRRTRKTVKRVKKATKERPPTRRRTLPLLKRRPKSNSSNHLMTRRRRRTTLLRRTKKPSRMINLRRAMENSLTPIPNPSLQRKAKRSPTKRKRRLTIPSCHLRPLATVQLAACLIFQYKPSTKLARLESSRCLNTLAFPFLTLTIIQPWRSTNSTISLDKCLQWIQCTVTSRIRVNMTTTKDHTNLWSIQRADMITRRRMERNSIRVYQLSNPYHTDTCTIIINLICLQHQTMSKCRHCRKTWLA